MTTIPLATTNDEISITVGGRSSYCCTIYPQALTATTNYYLSAVTAITTVARGNESPSLHPSNSDVSSRRLCFYIPNTSLVGGRKFKFNNFTTSVDTDVLCQQTTLRGNYNTSVSEFNFLEITSVAGSTGRTKVSGQVFLTRINGSTLESNFEFNYDTSPVARTDISIHDLLGGAADFGQVIIIHDGSPGQVKARVSQYDVTSTSPLNFTLVGQEALN
jgi:hypothetical protein